MNRPKIRLIALLACILFTGIAAAEEERVEIPLWPDGAPGSEGQDTPERYTRNDAGVVWRVNNIHNPSITPFLPAPGKATGAAVVILAGGGHRDLNVGPEGYDIARWLADRGVAGFVLKYRLAREEGAPYEVDVHAFADTQRAIRLVRSRAAEWNVDPARVGVMGFSAGGQLAYMACQRADERPAGSDDAIDQLDARPAFQALIYPGTPQRIQPTPQSPPAFMAVGFRDRTSKGLAEAYVRFHEAGVPAELHVYAAAGHPDGFRERDNTPASKWPERFHEWLADRGFLRPAAGPETTEPPTAQPPGDTSS